MIVQTSPEKALGKEGVADSRRTVFEEKRAIDNLGKNLLRLSQDFRGSTVQNSRAASMTI